MWPAGTRKWFSSSTCTVQAAPENRDRRRVRKVGKKLDDFLGRSIRSAVSRCGMQGLCSAGALGLSSDPWSTFWQETRDMLVPCQMCSFSGLQGCQGWMQPLNTLGGEFPLKMREVLLWLCRCWAMSFEKGWFEWGTSPVRSGSERTFACLILQKAESEEQGSLVWIHSR